MVKYYASLTGIIAVLLLGGCQDKSKNQPLNVSGRLLMSCDNPTPIANVTLTWGAPHTTKFTTTTDEDGYFHFSGTYDTEKLYENEVKEISVEGEAPYFYKDLVGHVSNQGDIGDIYYKNYVDFIIRVKTSETSIFTDQDTIRFPGRPSLTHPIPEMKFVGPFTNGQILDTVKMEVFPHVGYMPADANLPILIFYYPNEIYSSGVARSEFAPGQSNDVCGKYQELNAILEK